MKLTYKAILVYTLLTASTLSAYAAGEQEPFAGYVYDQTGKPVENATVTVNGAGYKTDKNGYFEIVVARTNRYTINAKKFGYGFSSQVEHDYGNTNLKLTLPKAETINIISSIDNTIKDSRGTQIILGANSLTDASGRLLKANTPVTVSVYTYNLDNEQMPGDMGFMDGSNATAGYLESAGVFSADFTDANGSAKYKLAAGKQAAISIPASSTESSVQLWSYDENKGAWKEDAKEASLNKNTGRYEGAVSHFTLWNFDWKKTEPACVTIEIEESFFEKFKQPGKNGGQLTIKAEVTSGGVKRVIDLSLGDMRNAVKNSPHVLYNLPPNATVKLFAGNFSIPYTVFNTGTPWGGKGRPTIPEYGKCKGNTTLTYPMNNK
ncbi:hypothetical protein F6R98_04395 [Candidatus Methylospira mobilis]|uniref:Carboxypeptidase regulatory-like domain-containing protein n=1 Tax=Candidatus Methylospira mobilis TaxID=1808979 RepID=A0A5Q0BDT1_9GAMM|nr:carboxypeptidase regulatory-like domain-containing protein [Candidatus Methylospira mobilis]QFY41960.1 hypothetical protein F6R98_04395 [Candidatus Methylospira mobilis]WNV02950.1 carboxypeptidase regulatory-like domain-containing protein [Candidatus Methylospira mobilis]